MCRMRRARQVRRVRTICRVIVGMRRTRMRPLSTTCRPGSRMSIWSVTAPLAIEDAVVVAGVLTKKPVPVARVSIEYPALPLKPSMVLTSAAPTTSALAARAMMRALIVTSAFSMFVTTMLMMMMARLSMSPCHEAALSHHARGVLRGNICKQRALLCRTVLHSWLKGGCCFGMVLLSLRGLR